MSSSFGRILRLTTFGESHGPACGAVLDGLPAGVKIDTEALQSYVNRRSPGRRLTSARAEKDRVEILSGLYEGVTLGTPLAMVIRNENKRPGDYAELADKYRPSHADLTWQLKYGIRDCRGGGRASARETAGRAMAAAAAEQFLEQYSALRNAENPQAGNEAVRNIFSIVCWIERIGSCAINYAPGQLENLLENVTRKDIDASPCRCPVTEASALMEEELKKAQSAGDSLGGAAVFAIRGLSAGLGDPVFDKLDSIIAGALMSIPSVKGVEIGGGFGLAQMRGSQANDTFEMRGGRPHLQTNRSGGILGGISTGDTVWGRIAFKPTPTIGLPQQTLNTALETVTIRAGGRHDPCTAVRGTAAAEAMLALACADCVLADSVCRLR